MTTEKAKLVACTNRGCGHDVSRHRLDQLSVWTERDEDGEIRQSNMGFTMECFDACPDIKHDAHQCHCMRFLAPGIPPSPDQLRERPW